VVKVSRHQPEICAQAMHRGHPPLPLCVRSTPSMSGTGTWCELVAGLRLLTAVFPTSYFDLKKSPRGGPLGGGD
jgi:hypothetical protein